MTWSETQLMRRLQRGESVAFEIVVERHYQSVFRQLWHFCHDCELAADLTQETFAQAWKSLTSFAGKSSVRTWLYSIAVRVWYRWLENSANQQNCVPLDEGIESLPDDALNPAQRLEAQTLREDAQTALQGLPAPYRETLVLFYMQNLKCREVSEVLEVPLGTVKSRLHEGLKRLKTALDKAEAVEAEILKGERQCEAELKTI